MVESLRSDHNFFMDELSKAVQTFREILADVGSPQHVAKQLDTIRERVDAVSLRLELHNALEEKKVYRWTESHLTRLRAGRFVTLSSALLNWSIIDMSEDYTSESSHDIQH